MRNEQRLPLVTGDAVVVEAAGSGWHPGHISHKGELVRLRMRKKKIPTDSKAIRPSLCIATPDDEERWVAVRDLETGTMFRARAGQWPRTNTAGLLWLAFPQNRRAGS